MTLLIGEWSLGLKSMAFVIFTGFVGTKMLLGRKRAGISGRNDVSRSRDDARDLIYCHPSDMLKDVLSIMKERGVVHLPIVDQNSTPVGWSMLAPFWWRRGMRN